MARSTTEIQIAIRELSARADLARTEGRDHDAADIERSIAGYRKELGERP